VTAVDPPSWLGNAPGFVEPAPGATLTGPIQVFRWDIGGRPLDRASLLVGATPGRTEYAWRNLGTDTETSVGGLPVDGSTVYVRLWVEIGGQSQILDAAYPTTTTPRLLAFTTPTPGRDLDGPTAAFGFDLAGLPVDDSWLYVGSEFGSSDVAMIRSGPLQADDLVAVGGLPTDRSTLYLRLYVLVAGIWHVTDATYRAADAAAEPFPTRDERVRQLQRLVGATADGVVGPRTRAALNRNWLGRSGSFDQSFAARFVDNADLVRWAQQALNHWFDTGLAETGLFDSATEAAAVAALGRGGVIAAESYETLLDGPASLPR
jgi:hypothetical protein